MSDEKRSTETLRTLFSDDEMGLLVELDAVRRRGDFDRSVVGEYSVPAILDKTEKVPAAERKHLIFARMVAEVLASGVRPNLSPEETAMFSGLGNWTRRHIADMFGNYGIPAVIINGELFSISKEPSEIEICLGVRLKRFSPQRSLTSMQCVAFQNFFSEDTLTGTCTIEYEARAGPIELDVSWSHWSNTEYDPDAPTLPDTSTTSIALRNSKDAVTCELQMAGEPPQIRDAVLTRHGIPHHFSSTGKRGYANVEVTMEELEDLFTSAYGTSLHDFLEDLPLQPVAMHACAQANLIGPSASTTMEQTKVDPPDSVSEAMRRLDTDLKRAAKWRRFQSCVSALSSI